MRFGDAFTFPFQDADWLKKVAIPAVCMLIPVVGPFIVMGFGLEIAKRFIHNNPELVPAFDFGGFLRTGFMGAVVSFVYSLPMVICMIPSYGFPAFAAAQGDDTMVIIGWVVLACCGCLALLLAIALMLLLPAALGKFLDEGTLGAAFQVGEIVKLVRADIVAFLIAIVGGVVGSIIAPLGMIACGIGVLFTYAYFFAIYGHFIGQAYTQAKAKVAAAG
jgi:hypothetical protein